MNAQRVSPKSFRPKRNNCKAFTPYEGNARNLPDKELLFQNNSTTRRTGSVPPLIMASHEPHDNTQRRPRSHNGSFHHRSHRSAARMKHGNDMTFLQESNDAQEDVDTFNNGVYPTEFMMFENQYSPEPPTPPQRTPTHLLSFDIVNQSIEHIEIVVRYGDRSYGGVLMKLALQD